MKLLLILISIFFLFPSVGMAESVRIDSKLFYGGKKIGSPRVLSKMGEKSKMFVKDTNSNRDYNLEVTTKRLSKNLVRLNYSLSIRERNNEILTRGSIKIADGSVGRVLLSKRMAEIQFKLNDPNISQGYLRN